MKRSMILLIGILILISCKDQKREIEKLLFDTSKMSNLTKYYYKQDSDKLISQIEKDYTIMFGQVVDSITTQTEFEYNNKGLLTKEISRSDFDEKPTIKVYNYNEFDSLIEMETINPENDTILWHRYKYYPDGKKTTFTRLLMTKFDPNQDVTQALRDKKYDTTIYVNEFDYIGNLCHVQRQYDKKHQLIKTINFNFQGERLIKEIQATYFNDIEITQKVKFYDYSKSDINPDFYSLDSQNDTIELGINEFNDRNLTNSTEIYDYGSTIRKNYYNTKKEIGIIVIDRKKNYKILESYEYYEDGKLKETKSYHEELTHTNTRS